jgi:hypothetical protein
MLAPSGEVYVRVVDRAGNVSAVRSGRPAGGWMLYLPLMMR